MDFMPPEGYIAGLYFYNALTLVWFHAGALLCDKFFLDVFETMF
jgi:hypothetical protein